LQQRQQLELQIMHQRQQQQHNRYPIHGRLEKIAEENKLRDDKKRKMAEKEKLRDDKRRQRPKFL
jgi:hypothetical protein